MPQFTINTAPPEGDNYHQWIVMHNGEEVARVKGPMSLGVAFAATKALNAGTVFYDGWADEALKLMEGQCNDINPTPR